MKILSLALFLSMSAVAATDLEKLPPAFTYKQAKAVFADWQLATYDIVYDVTTKTSTAVATIDLVTAEAGHPIFDVQAEPTAIELDGTVTTASLTPTPSNETMVRIVNTAVSAGRHTLKVTVPNANMIQFTDTGVHHGLWFGDLEDRSYMERFFPANFIFDRVPVIYNVTFIGAGEQVLYSNGTIRKTGDNKYQVVFPADYNLTCHYFHTVPFGASVEKRFSFKSIDGREVPVLIYRLVDDTDQTAYLQKLQDMTTAIMDELEKDYGAWPHPDMTVYVTASPSGGMEFTAATITSEKALGHELFHSYFARGVMPADGNSGWIDEALARWRDNGYQSITSLEGSSGMGGKPVYTRWTDRLAYSFGERFIALLDGTFKDQGGLKPFLRELVTHHLFDPMNNARFISLMNEHYSTRTEALFGRYILGASTSLQKSIVPHRYEKSDVHGQWTAEQLKSFL